jgi:hypothetical protein
MKEKNNQWYDRVYLCWENNEYNKSNPYSSIRGFNCLKNNSFEDAHSFWKNHRENLEARNTMIPICKWVPMIFDKFILNLKLKNIYWEGKHRIYNNTNNYDDINLIFRKPKEK